MNIISNEALIARNAKIGQFTSLGSLLVLGVGMYISFTKPEMFSISVGALLLGFIMSQVGIYFGNRWGRSPRPDTTDVVVAQLTEGQYFGEMQLLHGHGRSASVRASEHTPVEVLALDYETLGNLLEESEATRQAILEKANERQQQNREILGD